MSRIDCPSEAWDRHIAGEEAAADAAMAVEEEVLEKVEDAGYLAALSDRYELDVDPEGVFSDIIRIAYSKGYSQAIQDRQDNQAVYEFEQEQQRADKKYRVICYMRIEPEEDDWGIRPYGECVSEKKDLDLMQPENVYRIEEVEGGPSEEST